LNFIIADVCLMTTPGLEVFQLKRSKLCKHYSHILHSPTDATMYRLFGLDYFDSVLLTGDYQEKDIRTLEKQRNINKKQLVITGCTYLDVFAEKVNQLPKEENHCFTVLVSPSWGPSAILSRFGEKLIDPLVESGMKIIVRPHPQSRKSEAAMLDRLISKYKDVPNLEWDYKRENIFSLARADIMISDFSGIIFDFVFLFNKPVMYVMQGFDMRLYDAYDICENTIEKLWQFKTLSEIGIELKEEEFKNISFVLKNAADSMELQQARIRAKEAAWQYRGESGKRVVDYLISLCGQNQQSRP